MKLLGILVVLCGLIALSTHSCDSGGGVKETPQTTEKSKIKMAADSELALLMRELSDETEAIRDALLAGKEHPLWKRVEELHTATPTDASSSGPVFQGFSSAFIGAVAEMQAADSNRTQYFNAVIDRCMDCHATYCPGPMTRIEKFYVQK